jgi:hypothetical protein
MDKNHFNAVFLKSYNNQPLLWKYDLFNTHTTYTLSLKRWQIFPWGLSEILPISYDLQELDSPAVTALGVRSRKLSNALNGQPWDGWPKSYHLELLSGSEGTLRRWSRLHLQSLAPINPHWARVVVYGPFSLWVIHKEGLCPSSRDINTLMMMICRSDRW